MGGSKSQSSTSSNQSTANNTYQYDQKVTSADDSFAIGAGGTYTQVLPDNAVEIFNKLADTTLLSVKTNADVNASTIERLGENQASAIQAVTAGNNQALEKISERFDQQESDIANLVDLVKPISLAVVGIVAVSVFAK